MSPAFGREAVRLGEALYRSAGHCLAARELYARRRPADALLQAARPMTDVLPWLETEARSYTPQLGAFTGAVARIGSDIRAGVPSGSLRRDLVALDKVIDDFLTVAVGPAAGSEAYSSAVALGLLRSTCGSFERAVSTRNVGDYRTAYGTTRVALRLLPSVSEAHDMHELDPHLTLLYAAFPTVDPPEKLFSPQMVSDALEHLTTALTASYDLSSYGSEGVDESLIKIERLLDDAVTAHAKGVPALAARLAASLFIRTYDPIRADLASRDAAIEERLSELLGVEFRRAINAGASVEDLHALRLEAKQLIRSTGDADGPDEREENALTTSKGPANGSSNVAGSRAYRVQQLNALSRQRTARGR